MDQSLLTARDTIINGEVGSFVIFRLDESDKEKLAVAESGSGGLGGVSGILQGADGSKSVLFAYVKLSANDPDNPQRVKYVLIMWQGTSSPNVLRAAASNTHRPRLTRNFLHHADIAATSLDDIEETAVRSIIRKAGGADYDAGGKFEVGHESYDAGEGASGTEKASFAKAKPAAGGRKLIRKTGGSSSGATE